LEIKKLNLYIGNNKLIIRSVHCGAEHTFILTGNCFIYLDRYEVYSMGLNIKGQLGHGNF
jgi:alpha-tubulin suppressor-like RCC1 family protein